MLENTVLNVKEKIAYGLGAIGKDMMYMLSTSYVLYYYQDILGVNAWAMGVILLAARIFDAFNDPIMGVIAAKTKTKWGKFRPWIFIGTLSNSLVTFLLFSAPPSLSGGGLVAYAAVFYILWGVTYTMADIPFWSIVPAFTRPGAEREHLTQVGRTCATVGGAIVTVATMICVMALGSGDERVGFKWFALIISIFTGIVITYFSVMVKEKSTVDLKTNTVSDMFKALFKNDQAMTMALTIILINSAFYITANLAIYYYKYAVGGDNWYHKYTLFAVVGGVSQAVSMIALFPLCRKFMQATKVFRTALCGAVVGYLIFTGIVFAGMSYRMLYIPAVIIFSCNGLLMVLLTIFLADTVDYGELNNGAREESVIFSIQTLVVKFASGVSALVASACISIFNISKDTSEGAAQVLTGSSLRGLQITITILPMIIFFAACVVFIKKYKLDEEKMASITSALEERRKIKDTEGE
ncbi:MAG: glycoside-pentoside-hexuronide (GPH):cation symporter [Clostridia bacterium]|nr:glycoside-pentoside-hexuronide (GPH):cation symporter [Clostridia bacterium]